MQLSEQLLILYILKAYKNAKKMNFQNNMESFCLFLTYLLSSDYYETCADYVKQEKEELLLLENFQFGGYI